MRRKNVLGAALALIGLHSAHAYNPTPDPIKEAALRNWMDVKYGMFIHWGPVSLTGQEIGWSRTNANVGTYDNLYKRFNPSLFNAEAWVKIAKDAGMKYMVLTVKHHDGFSMYDTKFSTYNIMRSPFGRDILKELSEACRKNGLLFGAYYSIVDWWHPDYIHFSSGGASHGGPGFALPAGTTPDFSRYVTYVRNQVKEIVANYPVDFIWYDGWTEEWTRNGKTSWTYQEGWDLYNDVKAVNPKVFVNNRAGNGKVDDWGDEVNFGYDKLDADYAGDYATPETRDGKFTIQIPWESGTTIKPQWAWSGSTPYPLNDLLSLLIVAVGGGGNYLLNVGPKPDGTIDAPEISRLKEIRTWLDRFGEGIYNVRGGPYTVKNTRNPAAEGMLDWGASTHRDSTVYLFIRNWQGKTSMEFPALKQNIRKSTFMTNSGQVQQANGKLIITVANTSQPVATVVKLELDGAVTEIIDRETGLTDAIPPRASAKWVSQGATYTTSSLEADSSKKAFLLNGMPYQGTSAFSTRLEANPFIEIDLKSPVRIQRIRIDNRANADDWVGSLQERARTLTVWHSEDKTDWKPLWKANKVNMFWDIVPAGERPIARYLKIGLQESNYLHLKRVLVFGDANPVAIGPGKSPAGKSDASSLSWDGRSLDFSLTGPASVGWEIFTPAGKRVAGCARRLMPAGRIRLPAAGGAGRHGLHLLRLQVNDSHYLRASVIWPGPGPTPGGSP
jgi:alpha-L-fucosidase